MNKQKTNIKEDMNINEEFLNLFSSDKKKKKKERKIKETIDMTETVKNAKTINKEDNKGKDILKQSITNNMLDNIDVTIEKNEIVLIRKVLDIIDKLKKDNGINKK